MSGLISFQLGLTVVTSIFIVFLVISFGWFLIWKAFLSKFRLVRELLGQNIEQGEENREQQQINNRPIKVKKSRID